MGISNNTILRRIPTMSLFPSLDNIEEEEPKIEGGLNITFSTVEYTYQSFLNKLLDGSMSDLLIQQNILNHYDKYCNYDNFQNPEIAPVMRKIWTNERFLINFKTVLNSKKKIHIGLYNRFICKIAYDYYAYKIAPDNLENDKICNLLFDIVTTLNESKIIPLTAYIFQKDAMFIVMIANSSYDYFTCVNRVNYFIMETLNGLDVIQIIDIYSKVFNDGNFGIIYNATMSDVPANFDSLTPPEGACYLKITKAIFVILNSIPSSEISKVIRGYKNYIAMHNVQSRVDIEKFIKDYPRAKMVFDALWYD